MNDYRAYVECDYNFIYHHGVKGQKWGHRRYQNQDGSLTPEGMARYKKYRDMYMRAGYSRKQASELATRKQQQHDAKMRRKYKNGAAAAGAATAFGAYDMFTRGRNAYQMGKSIKRGTLRKDLDDWSRFRKNDADSFGAYMRRKSKATAARTTGLSTKVKKGLGFTEKYVKGHKVDADGVLNPIMKTRLTKKGKIGLAVAGAAALGAGGYALYKRNKKKKQKQKQRQQNR